MNNPGYASTIFKLLNAFLCSLNDKVSLAKLIIGSSEFSHENFHSLDERSTGKSSKWTA